MQFHPRHLAGALPSTLHVLRLYQISNTSSFVTGELLAQVPQLGELALGGYHQYRLTAETLAPLTQLRVLRVSGRAQQRMEAGVLPPSLQRLIVFATMDAVADWLVPMAVRHTGLVVECDTSAHNLRRVRPTVEVFDESRRMAARSQQPLDQEAATVDVQHNQQHGQSCAGNKIDLCVD